MNSTQQLAEVLSSITDIPKVIEDVLSRLTRLESTALSQSAKTEDGWITLEKAASVIGKSVTALRQRIKHPTKPLPKGRVWKQEVKGGTIYVNLKQLRNYL